MPGDIGAALSSVSAIDTVLAALEERECNPRGSYERGWVALCPAHADRNPSLSIAWDGEKVLLHCFAGCSFAAICEKLGLTQREAFDGEGWSQIFAPLRQPRTGPRRYLYLAD